MGQGLASSDGQGLRVLFRTDGNHQQGMGDVLGCIALAQEFGTVTPHVLFLIQDYEEARLIIEKFGYPLRLLPRDPPVEQEIEEIRQWGPEVIIVNKLDNPVDYMARLRPLAFLVSMDDKGEGADYAHLRINVLYHRKRAVTSPRYVALRAELQKLHHRPRKIAETVRRILVTQGGSDTYGFTPKIARALGRLAGDWETDVVIGPAFRHHAELSEAMSQGGLSCRLLYQPSNLAELMLRADMAITAGGNTMFELACLGTPSVVVCGDYFEEETAHRFHRQGIAVNLGFGARVSEEDIMEAVEHLRLNWPLRKEMSFKGKKLVDGRGARRTVRLIQSRLRRWAEATRQP